MAADGVAIVARGMRWMGYVFVILGVVGVAFGLAYPNYRSYVIRGGVAILFGWWLTTMPRQFADDRARILRGEAPKRRWF